MHGIVLIDLHPGCRVEIAVKYRAKDIHSIIEHIWEPDNITRPAVNMSWAPIHDHITLNPLHVVNRAQIDQLRKLVV